MKKTEKKKLVLAKETLRTLGMELGRVAGGASDDMQGCIPYTADHTCTCTESCNCTSPSARFVCR
jgi:hypothetical protein